MKTLPNHLLRFKRFSPVALLLMFSTLATCFHGISAMAADAVFAEHFANKTGAAIPVAGLDGKWAVYYGPQATDDSSLKRGAYVDFEKGADGEDGFLRFDYATAGAASGRYQFAVVDSDINLTLSEGDIISWQAVGHNSAIRVQLLLQVNGTWYISTNTFTVANNGLKWSTSSKNQIHSLTFSRNTLDWAHFLLESNVKLEPGEALSGDLPEGRVTGIGLFLRNTDESQGTSSFIDDLKISPGDK